MFHFLVLINTINGRNVFESEESCKENRKYERKYNLCEIFIVVSVRMPGEILEDRKVWDDTGLSKIKVSCICLFNTKNPIRDIKV